MSVSTKYGRTFHFPFSPGTTGDDRINTDYWQDIASIPELVYTEKLDGENNCLNRHGVFARSHAAPSASPWTAHLRQRWSLIKADLGNYEIFIENLFAVHSIVYRQLPAHYHVFAIRELDQWLSWEETEFIAGFFDLPIVPVIKRGPAGFNVSVFQQDIIRLSLRPGTYDTTDIGDGKPCSMEGLVVRNSAGYNADRFGQNVFKCVRAGHVKTDVHWTRNWKRAPLKTETKCGQ